MRLTAFMLAVISLLLCGSVVAAPNQSKTDALFATIVTREKQILDTVKDNDIDAFSDLLADDLLAIDEDGFHTRAELVGEFREQKKGGLLFTGYKMEDIRLISVGRDAVVLAYKETLLGTDRGKPFVLHINTHSLYQRRMGKWVFRLFQDTPAK